MRSLTPPTLVLELSGENVPLARAEALGALRALGWEVAPGWEESADGPILRLSPRMKGSGEGDFPTVAEAVRLGRAMACRLGFCHHVGFSLASDWREPGDPSDGYLEYLAMVVLVAVPEVIEALKESGGDDDRAEPAGTNGAEGFTFSVRGRRYGEGGCPSPSALEGRMAAAVKRVVPGATVCLDSPDIVIRVPGHDRLHPTVLIGSVERPAQDGRVPTKRPFFRPTSLHPRLARAMVNLTGAPAGSRVRDPFCGTGGIIIEAALMGYRTVGSDIDPTMVKGARENLSGIDVEGAVVDEADIRSLGPGVPPDDAWVTEPPYGRASSHGQEELKGLYRALLDGARMWLADEGRLVTSFPSEDLIPDAPPGLSPAGGFPMRVHGGLTRHIRVFERGGKGVE